MSDCIKCGSKKAYWMIRDKENKAEYYCDPCFKKYDLADYKKEMDEYHKNKNDTLQDKSSSVIDDTVVAQLNEFYAIDKTEELNDLINTYPTDSLLPMIIAIDIDKITVKSDSPGMYGMQCMKILELSRLLRDAGRKDEMRICYEKLLKLCDIYWEDDNSGVYSQVMRQVGMDIMQDTEDPKLVLDNMKKAYNAFDSLRSRDFADAASFAWQAACAFNLGERDNARLLIQQVLRIEPSHNMANEMLKKLGPIEKVDESKDISELDLLRRLLVRNPDPYKLTGELKKNGFWEFENTQFGTVCTGKAGRLWFFADSSSGKISQAKYLDKKSGKTIRLIG